MNPTDPPPTPPPDAPAGHRDRTPDRDPVAPPSGVAPGRREPTADRAPAGSSSGVPAGRGGRAADRGPMAPPSGVAVGRRGATVDRAAVAPPRDAQAGPCDRTADHVPVTSAPGGSAGWGGQVAEWGPGGRSKRCVCVAGLRSGAVLWSFRSAALALGLGCVAGTLWEGLDDRVAALAFGLLVVVGEAARRSGADGREAAPLGAAGGLAYALLGAHDGALQAVAVVGAAALLGNVPHIASGRHPTPDHLTRRVLTVGFAAVCFQPLDTRGALEQWGGPAYALLLVALLVLTALCDAVLAAAQAHSRTGWPFGPLLRDELRGLLGIGSAVCATGAVMALAVAVVGLWALPVFCLPLLLTQLSLRRYEAVRGTYRQTIASLARATEIAGYTPAGHARRVAALSQAVGRDLGLSRAELTVLEYAALMHDIGQLSLVDPVPAGATAVLPAAEQRRIALLGGAVVRQTGVAAAVAVVVERQADPYREQPLAARIVRVVNAYEEKSRDSGPGGQLTALEELRLATAGDYAPEVVEALARVLARDCLTLRAAG